MPRMRELPPYADNAKRRLWRPVGSFAATLDYIWYSKHFKVRSLLGLPSLKEVSLPHRAVLHVLNCSVMCIVCHRARVFRGVFGGRVVDASTLQYTYLHRVCVVWPR